MENTNTIWNYFDESIDYPSEVAHSTLPYGTAWCYISSTFLNGLINYVKPVSVFVLDRYTSGDESISDRNIQVCNKGEFGKWHKWDGTKKELINALQNGDKQMYHVDLSCFDDDVVLLCEIETNQQDNKGRYMFFWFDCDVSDCCIGKFETDDSKQQVIQSLKSWLEQTMAENKDKDFESGYDNGIHAYSELPVNFLQGWVKF